MKKQSSKRANQNVDKFPLEDLTIRLPHQINIIIGCASFEQRSLSVAQSIDRDRFDVSIIFYNEMLEEKMSEEIRYFRTKWESNFVPIGLDDPIRSEDIIAATLGSLCDSLLQPENTCVIDISTFPREILLILINRLKNVIHPSTRLFLIYTIAKSYSFAEEPEQKWLTRGVRDIRSVAGYPGEMFPSRQTHLIVLGGYESDRAIQLVEQYEPHYLSIGYPPLSASVTPEMHAEAQFFKKRVMTFFDNIEEFDFSATNPFEVEEAIWKQAQKFKRTNVVVAPLNTKISTVGTALSAFKHPEIQLCYAQGDLYNYAGYSKSSSNCYLIELPLGSVY